MSICVYKIKQNKNIRKQVRGMQVSETMIRILVDIRVVVSESCSSFIFSQPSCRNVASQRITSANVRYATTLSAAFSFHLAHPVAEIPRCGWRRLGADDSSSRCSARLCATRYFFRNCRLSWRAFAESVTIVTA